MMNLFPTNLEIEQETKLVIQWNDETQQRVSVRTLRDRCPCSVCRDEARKPPEPAPSNPFTILSDADLQPLRIQAMSPVGNYGYKISFSDGHSTGIYSFEYLQSLND